MKIKVEAFSTWVLNLICENPVKFHLIFDVLIFVPLFFIFYFFQWETQFFTVILFCYLSAIIGFQFSKVFLTNYNPFQKFRKHYRLIAENLNDIVVIHRCQTGKTEYINEAAFSVLGYKQIELLKQPTLLIIHPDDRRKAKTLLMQFDNNNNYFISEKVRVNSKSGEYKWMELSIKSLNNDFEKTNSAIIIFRDITETIELEKATQRFADELYEKYLKQERQNKLIPQALRV